MKLVLFIVSHSIDLDHISKTALSRKAVGTCTSEVCSWYMYFRGLQLVHVVQRSAAGTCSSEVLVMLGSDVIVWLKY